MAVERFDNFNDKNDRIAEESERKSEGGKSGRKSQAELSGGRVRWKSQGGRGPGVK